MRENIFSPPRNSTEDVYKKVHEKERPERDSLDEKLWFLYEWILFFYFPLFIPSFCAFGGSSLSWQCFPYISDQFTPIRVLAESLKKYL